MVAVSWGLGNKTTLLVHTLYNWSELKKKNHRWLMVTRGTWTAVSWFDPSTHVFSARELIISIEASNMLETVPGVRWSTDKINTLGTLWTFESILPGVQKVELSLTVPMSTDDVQRWCSSSVMRSRWSIAAIATGSVVQREWNVAAWVNKWPSPSIGLTMTNIIHRCFCFGNVCKLHQRTLKRSAPHPPQFNAVNKLISLDY